MTDEDTDTETEELFEGRELPGGLREDFTLEPDTYEERRGQYRAAAEFFGLSPETIYHPAHYDDVTPSEVFPEAHVILLQRL